ncbi:MAG: class I SAM-dependent methyltransferase [Clostridia bacterium]
MKKDYDYKKWRDYFLSFLLPSHKTGVDLACGTGIMTYLLSESEKKMIGIDNCSEMLVKAQQHKKSSCYCPQFVLCDMRKFTLNQKVDFVTCCCDGFNYINQSDISKLFFRIYNYLEKGGILIFDISSENKLRNVIGENIFYSDTENLTYLWTNEQLEDSVEMSITLFYKEKDGKYNRKDEKHIQFVHNYTSILFDLKNVGFSEAHCYKFLTLDLPSGKEDRICFVAKK